jgi:hypothetical protein
MSSASSLMLSIARRVAPSRFTLAHTMPPAPTTPAPSASDAQTRNAECSADAARPAPRIEIKLALTKLPIETYAERSPLSSIAACRSTRRSCLTRSARVEGDCDSS